MNENGDNKFDWRKVLKREKKPAKSPGPSPVKKAVEAVRENGRKLKAVAKRPLANWELFRTWVLIILVGMIIWQAVIGWGPTVNRAAYAAGRALGQGVYHYAWQVPHGRYQAWQRDRAFKGIAETVEQETWLEVIAYRWDEHEFEYGTQEGTRETANIKSARWAITPNWEEYQLLSPEEAKQQWAFGLAFFMARSVCQKCLGADRVYFVQLETLVEAPRSGEMVYQWSYDMDIAAKDIWEFLGEGSIDYAKVHAFLTPYAQRRFAWFVMWRQAFGPIPFTGAGWTWH